MSSPMEEMQIQHQDDPTQHHQRQHIPIRKTHQDGLPPPPYHHQPQQEDHHPQQHIPIRKTHQDGLPPPPYHHQPQQEDHHPQHHPMDNKSMFPPRYRVPNGPKREHCICITIFILILGIILLILWLAYHPTKPHFTIASAAIYGLNATTPPFINIKMQFTIFIRNPNKRVSIYFDRLSTFVSYRNQPITPHLMLPSLYLEKHGTVSMAPELGGTPVTVSAEVSNGIVGDVNYGVVGVKLVFQGRLRWKTGEIKSAHYGMYVKCDLLLGLKKGLVGQIPLLGAPLCDVDT